MADLGYELLADGFGRVDETVTQVLHGLVAGDLSWRPDPQANPIGWLVWHLARVEDDHLADLAKRDQVWVEGGWQDELGLPYPAETVGYGQSSDEVGQFVVSGPEPLLGYYAAVHRRTLEILEPLTAADYERVLDERWDPPVTAAVRVVSVLNDITQHVGQAGYVRGLLDRR